MYIFDNNLACCVQWDPNPPVPNLDEIQVTMRREKGIHSYFSLWNRSKSYSTRRGSR